MKKINEKEFEQLKHEKIASIQGKITALTSEFHDIKEKLLHAKKELKIWQDLPYKNYNNPS